MKKRKRTRDVSIKGIKHKVGKVAEVSEEDAQVLVGMGKAAYEAGKETAKKAKKK